MSKYRVVIGSEFEITGMDVPNVGAINAASKAAVQFADQKTRRSLAFAVLAIACAALVIGACADFASHPGTWSATVAVWAAAAVPLGAVFGFYFSNDR